MMTDSGLFAFALGIGTVSRQGEWLEVFYPRPQLRPQSDCTRMLHRIFDWSGATLVHQASPQQLAAIADMLQDNCPEARELSDCDTSGNRRPVVVALSEDKPPQSVPEAYLKLHLLSHRLCRPNELNLDGIFGTLVNVAWTSQGAIDLNELPQRQLQARLHGETLRVFSVDKFPQLTDYLVPKGVRIADSARVRLGAWLGEGTTIMHEGFVNFNAGTEGPNMIEGRISAGVKVGSGSDLGGGSSTMGTLSGGNQTLISVGKNCLIGANAGTGIPLGDGCVIEAGLYVTAGAPIRILDGAGNCRGVCKARELAGQDKLLFRRNTQSGALECLPTENTVNLNPVLHDNKGQTDD